MRGTDNITLKTALIGAVATILVGALAAWATASTTANAELNDLRSDQRVLENTQSLQYQELKGLVTESRADIKEILRAVK